MTLPDLKLEWQRCPDGVEVIDLPTPPPRTEIVRVGFYNLRRQRVPSIFDEVGGGWHFRCKSDDRKRLPLTMNLEDPVVVRFINATTIDALIKFFGRYGLPDGRGETAVEVETDRRAGFTEMLEKAASGDPDLAGPAVARLNKDIRLRPAFDEQSRRLVLRVGSLRDFMAMEIVLAAVAGARLGRCRSCGSIFLTGLGTGGRSTRKFCGDRCRQRRWRKHEKEGSNVSSKAKVEARKRT